MLSQLEIVVSRDGRSSWVCCFPLLNFFRKIVEVSVCFVSLAWNATKEITLVCALGGGINFTLSLGCGQCVNMPLAELPLT